MKNKSHQVSESESNPDDPDEVENNSSSDEEDDSKHHDNINEANSNSPTVQSQNSVKSDDYILTQIEKTSHIKNNSSFSEHNKQNPSSKATFYIDEITEDDEIFSFQCPKDFNIKDLLNKSIDFKNRQKLSSKKESLHLDVLETDKKFLTLAVPKKTGSGCLISVPLKGHIIVQKDVKVTQGEGVDTDDCDIITFPKNIKVRHPLLGIDWKSQIEVAEKAIEKQRLLKKKLKKEKKEKMKRKEENERKGEKREATPDDVFVNTKKRKRN